MPVPVSQGLNAPQVHSALGPIGGLTPSLQGLSTGALEATGSKAPKGSPHPSKLVMEVGRAQNLQAVQLMPYNDTTPEPSHALDATLRDLSSITSADTSPDAASLTAALDRLQQLTSSLGSAWQEENQPLPIRGVRGVAVGDPTKCAGTSLSNPCP